MNASIITIGDELLIGQVVNTNSAWLAAELTAIGFSVGTHVSISDKREDIVKTLEQNIRTAELIIFTGGLGPTNDDITKKVLSDYFCTELVFSEEVLADVESKVRGWGSTMNSKNREQAMVPRDAKILRNYHGTAPGMWFEKNGKVIISLPGVPREMKGIYNDCIKAELTSYFSLPPLLYKTIMLTGISEAHLAEKLENWESSLPEGMSLAYLPSPEAIRLRLGFTGRTRKEAEKTIEKEAAKLDKIIPKYIYGYDNESIESVVGGIIAGQGGMLACAESCTGGTIAGRITAIPGCSAWFRGGVVAYSNEIKMKLLGVEAETLNRQGAVSGETVAEMAEGARRVLDADYAVATSGIAGPAGGTEAKPVGTVWVAAAGPGFLKTKKFSFGADRNMNIRRSATAAFSLLRQALLESGDSDA